MTQELIASCNDIIQRSNEEAIYLSPTKLQKMLFFLYGHYYAHTGKQLFKETFKAWQYGPVVPEVYNKVKKQNKGSFDVSKLFVDDNGKVIITNPNSEYGITYFNVFEKVWNKYKNLNASTLSLLTHANDSPWDVTVKTDGELAVIPPEIICKYFKGESIANEQ